MSFRRSLRSGQHEKSSICATGDRRFRKVRGAIGHPLPPCLALVFVDDVPTSCSLLGCLDAAGRLERELATVAAYVDELRDLLDGDARASLLVNALARVIVSAEQLRQQVHRAATSADDATIEGHEHALRARFNIVVRALYALKSNERDIPASAYTARCCSLRDVSALLVDQLAGIHEQWLGQRGADPRLDLPTRQAIAYAALDEAEIAFERLGHDEALGQFLRVGASNASVSIATACREIAATIGLTLSDPQLDDRSSRSVAEELVS